ncbi:L,D-transpeptidase [Sphingobacterium olei]|uniref:L,D-transpeptidase n=1 Tax=Sphingobacterium olei TaxID=2571155 RepID=A0A4U0P018_9SPHI|nr:L,D-transpeptidase [Sphingobacterium olei]TJZ59832.1 L,D-transpeptidase [Sphingobacterium olei]
MTKYIHLIVLCAIMFTQAACNRGAKNNNDGSTDSLAHKEIEPFEGGYDSLLIKGAADPDSALAEFEKRYSEEQRQVILALNRIDRYHIKQADMLVVPDSVWTDLSVYSPFPPRLKELQEIHKIIFFSYPYQAFAVYENGLQVRWGPTSMGTQKDSTPVGLFFANWKAEEHISTVDDEWLLKWNFNIENEKGVGWHLYAMPGYPASHSCLRLLENDARWLYDWADMWVLEGEHDVKAQGTPVIVFGSYDFSQKGPWLNLPDDPDANTISEADLKRELESHLQKIQEEQERRRHVIQGEKRDSTVAK